jgi:DNA-binding HxlR family transcriptional regulator
LEYASDPNLQIPVAIQIVAKGKWRLPILAQLLVEPRRLSELMRLLPQASKKMILETLQSLIALGWVERIDLGGKMKHVEYRLYRPLASEIRLLLEFLANRGASTRERS